MKSKPAVKSRRRILRELRIACEQAELAHIRQRLDMPFEKRLNFLRVRLPNGGSCL